MGVRAIFTEVATTTQKKAKDSSSWESAKVDDTLSDGDRSRDNPDPGGNAYTVDLYSSAEVQFLEESLTPVNLTNINGAVAYSTDMENWTELDEEDSGNYNVKAVDTDSTGSVSIVVTDGSRGIIRPPEWTGPQ